MKRLKHIKRVMKDENNSTFTEDIKIDTHFGSDS
jgi:hypothetical protein